MIICFSGTSTGWPLISASSANPAQSTASSLSLQVVQVLFLEIPPHQNLILLDNYTIHNLVPITSTTVVHVRVGVYLNILVQSSTFNITLCMRIMYYSVFVFLGLLAWDYPTMLHCNTATWLLNTTWFTVSRNISTCYTYMDVYLSNDFYHGPCLIIGNRSYVKCLMIRN